MTDTTRSFAKPASEGIQLLPYAVGVLFFFVAWKTTGVSWGPSPQDVMVEKETIQQDLEVRAAGSSLIEQLIWVVFGCFGLFLHMVNRENAKHTWSQAWPLLLLLGLIVLSTTWSAVPDIALRRVIKQLLLVVAIAGVVMGAGSPRDIFRLAVVFTGFIMLANIASVALFPGAAIDATGAFRGLHVHKNTAGAFTMIAVFVWFSAARWSQGAWMRGLLYAGTLIWFVFLLGTISRTAIGCTILALTVVLLLGYFVRHPRMGVICTIGAILASLGAIYTLFLFNFSFVEIIDVIEGDKTTLTGRSVIWGVVYQVFLDHMLVGVGYGSLWSTGDVAALQAYGNLNLTGFLLRITQAHSGYFDVLATLGLVGAIIFLVFVVSAAAAVLRALRSGDSDRESMALAEMSGFILVSVLVTNVTETTFLTTKIGWSALLLCYLFLASARSRTHPAVEPALRSSSASGISIPN